MNSILINKLPFTIIGVSAPGFFGVDSSLEPAIFLPLHAQPRFSLKPPDEERRRFLDSNFYWLEMMARLQPGVDIRRADAVLASTFKQFVESTATNSSVTRSGTRRENAFFFRMAIGRRE